MIVVQAREPSSERGEQLLAACMPAARTLAAGDLAVSIRPFLSLSLFVILLFDEWLLSLQHCMCV